VRTWDENREAMNQLWPTHEWTNEERKLVCEDLSPLDQDVLYDAIRNAKRNHDTPFVHLKWLIDEYALLVLLRKRAAARARALAAEPEPRQVVKIDADENARMRSELKTVIENATAGDYHSIVDVIADQAAKCKMEMSTAFGLITYLQQRLGMNNGGRIGDAA